MRRWIDQWAAVYPGGVEECRGIAAGAGLGRGPLPGPPSATTRLSGELPQCTLIGRRGNGSARFGKTDDIERRQLGLNLLEISRPADGHDHLHFHFAATALDRGRREPAGAGHGHDRHPGADEGGGGPVLAHGPCTPCCPPAPTWARPSSTCGTLPVNAYGFSLMLGDAGGRLALVEKTGRRGWTVVEAEAGRPPRGIRTTSSTPISPAGTRPRAPPIDANGRRRLDNALRLAEGRYRHWSGSWPTVPPPGPSVSRGRTGCTPTSPSSSSRWRGACACGPARPPLVEPAEYDLERTAGLTPSPA